MITRLFRQDIQLINNSIYNLLEEIDHPVVKGETKRLIETGGKRLRPLFLVWSSDLSKEAYSAAASLELLHTSSLIHDDIIDNSPYRRGAETTLKVFGRERATSIGTVLSLFSIDKIISIQNQDISATLADTLENLCSGELKQLDERFDFNCSCNDYITKISHKTASLFALPCKMGGVIGGCEQSQIESLYQVGYNIGCSFQILDDIKDITFNAEDTGKESNEDIRNGIITLPYLILMEKDEGFKDLVTNLSAESTSEDFDFIIKKLKDSDALEESYRYSNQFLDKARKTLSTIKSERTREKFNHIIDWLYR